MNIQLIQIPYDSGHESLRTGRGPDYFIERGVGQILRDSGHQTTSRRLVSQLDFIADIEATFELNGVLAKEVQQSITAGKFPFVLAGACHCNVGVLGGIGLLGGIGQNPIGLDDLVDHFAEVFSNDSLAESIAARGMADAQRFTRGRFDTEWVRYLKVRCLRAEPVVTAIHPPRSSGRIVILPGSG